VPIEVGQLSIVAPNYQNGYYSVASLDYNGSSSDQVRMRYVYNRTVTLDFKANLPVFFQIEPTSYHLATISEYHNFSPTLTNEPRAVAPINFVQPGRGDYQYSTLDLYLRDLAPDQFANRTLGNPTFYGDNWALYGYANDTWRVRPNLSVNLGLRYEYTSLPYS